MGINGKKKEFHVDTFYHQIKTNCTEFGIKMEVIDRFIGQVDEIKRKKIWETKKGEQEDAQDL